VADTTKPLEFTNSDLNKKYVIVAEVDHEIIAPEGYKGKLSRAPERVIEGLLQRKSNLVAPKAGNATK